MFGFKNFIDFLKMLPFIQVIDHDPLLADRCVFPGSDPAAVAVTETEVQIVMEFTQMERCRVSVVVVCGMVVKLHDQVPYHQYVPL